MKRHNHYEAAFEDYLRHRQLPYVAVDECKRSIWATTGTVKSFDFIVYQQANVGWLVDVKGRKFPYVTPNGKRYWENWVKLEDLQDLQRWESVFGSNFSAVLVFAYWLTTEASHGFSAHQFRGSRYVFLAVPLRDYDAHCIPRSRKWETFSLPSRQFRRMAVQF